MGMLSVIVNGSTTDLETLVNLVAHDGWGTPPLHLLTRRGPMQHGESVIDYRLDPRIGQLVFRLPATTLDGMYALRQLLNAILAPQNQLSLKFTLSYGVRQIDGRVEQGNMSWQAGDWAAQKVSYTIHCPDPSFYDPAAAAISFLAGGGGGTGTGGTGTGGAAAAVFTPTIGSTVYYVDKANGNDNFNGLSTGAPFKTLNHAVSVLTAGATLYIRGNTYNERLVVTANGASGNYINVLAYPGETVVIDGTGGLGMGLYDPLVNAYGNYIYFGNLEIRNSVGMGVFLNGINNVVHGCYVHHAQSNGILGGGDGSIIEYNRIWRSCLMNEFGKSSTWPSACSTARETGDLITDNGIIRSNIVWENWGEGISSYQSTNTIIEDNIVHDSFSANLYVSDSTGVVVRRNFVYADFTNSYMYTGLIAQGSYVGIMDGSELQSPSLANITIVDNVVYGCNRDYYWWINAAGDHMIGYTIANNIFANGPNYAVQIAQAAHTTSIFENNIVIQDDSAQQIVSLSTNITYSNNIWSKSLPSGTGSGTGDVVGDPLLIRSGSPYTSPWSSDYYKPQPSSPAVGAGLTITASSLDYYRVTRSAPYDIGPIEYQATTGSVADSFDVPMAVPTGVGASTMSLSIPVSYTGTWPSFPHLIRITGPVTGCVITNTLTGDKLDLTGVTIDLGHYLDIDCRYGYKTVKLDGVTDHLEYLTGDSDLATFSLQPAIDGTGVRINTISVTGSNIATLTRVDINYLTRYAGI